ncbi:recombinase family protein [Salmonella enterica subsp. enterica serovar Rubislaw]|nr:recombinase family protein [Salmonella enterica subsp. enterica serovar Rubislaw]
MANIGYIRVSTTHQNTERQLHGVELDKTFTDKMSGKNLDRPQFKEMMSYVREGDVLHVHSLDRLGRDLCDVLNVIRELNEKGVALYAHKEGINTSNASPMQTAMIQLMGVFAELERSMINERRAEAVAVAKEKGTYKPRGNGKDVDRAGIKANLEAGLSVRKTAAKYAVSTQTVQRIKAED